MVGVNVRSKRPTFRTSSYSSRERAIYHVGVQYLERVVRRARSAMGDVLRAAEATLIFLGDTLHRDGIAVLVATGPLPRKVAEGDGPLETAHVVLHVVLYLPRAIGDRIRHMRC